MRLTPRVWLPLVALLGAPVANANADDVADGPAPAGAPKKSAAKSAAARPRAAPRTGPVATLPGFEMRSDGSSVVFVQLSKTVIAKERKAKGRLIYVLEGARVGVRNNQNPLVTAHFDTPVARAQLQPAGNDLWLVIELRADAQTSWRVTPAKDGTATLQIEFPRYLPKAGDAAKPADDAAKDPPKK